MLPYPFPGMSGVTGIAQRRGSPVGDIEDCLTWNLRHIISRWINVALSYAVLSDHYGRITSKNSHQVSEYSAVVGIDVWPATRQFASIVFCRAYE